MNTVSPIFASDCIDKENPPDNIYKVKSSFKMSEKDFVKNVESLKFEDVCEEAPSAKYDDFLNSLSDSMSQVSESGKSDSMCGDKELVDTKGKKEITKDPFCNPAFDQLAQLLLKDSNYKYVPLDNNTSDSYQEFLDDLGAINRDKEKKKEEKVERRHFQNAHYAKEGALKAAEYALIEGPSGAIGKGAGKVVGTGVKYAVELAQEKFGNQDPRTRVGLKKLFPEDREKIAMVRGATGLFLVLYGGASIGATVATMGASGVIMGPIGASVELGSAVIEAGLGRGKDREKYFVGRQGAQNIQGIQDDDDQGGLRPVQGKRSRKTSTGRKTKAHGSLSEKAVEEGVNSGTHKAAHIVAERVLEEAADAVTTGASNAGQSVAEGVTHGATTAGHAATEAVTHGATTAGHAATEAVTHGATTAGHAATEAVTHGATNAGQAVAEGVSHGATTAGQAGADAVAHGTAHGVEHATSFMGASGAEAAAHALPLLQVYFITRGFKKMYQAYKGIEHGHEFLLAMEENFKKLAVSRATETRNLILAGLFGASQMMDKNIHSSEPSKVPSSFKNQVHCLCNALKWEDDYIHDANKEFDKSIKFLKTRLKRKEHRKQLAKAVLGDNNASHMKELAMYSWQYQGNLEMENDELREHLKALHGKKGFDIENDNGYKNLPKIPPTPKEYEHETGFGPISQPYPQRTKDLDLLKDITSKQMNRLNALEAHNTYLIGKVADAIQAHEKDGQKLIEIPKLNFYQPTGKNKFEVEYIRREKVMNDAFPTLKNDPTTGQPMFRTYRKEVFKDHKERKADMKAIKKGVKKLKEQQANEL